MKRTYGVIAMVMLLVVGLVACGREQVAPPAAVQSIDAKPKDDANKVSRPPEAAKAVDPLKDGY